MAETLHGPRTEPEMNIQTQQDKAQSRTRDPLLSEFRLKHLVMRNRIISTSHAATAGGGGYPREQYQAYHEEKAKGGLAMTMIGGSSQVSPDSNWGGNQMDVSHDDVIPYLQQMSERVHRHGAHIMCQISHLGRRADATASQWLPAQGPSRMREMRHRAVSHEIEEADIFRIIRDYAAAARRLKEGGFDGCETLAGGHLIGQFLSPLTNHRSDRWGGSVQNRTRFAIAVHDAIRAEVGDDFVVGMRYVVDEGDGTGLSFEDCVEIAGILQRETTIDFFNCIFGKMDTGLALVEHNMPNMARPMAPFLRQVGQFKAEVKLPVFHAARIPDLETARYAISEGLLDLVGMTRAHIADPYIVRKLERGEADRIRPCIGSSHCLYRLGNCIHNASSNREFKLPHIVPPAPATKKAVVVGGGPAGLEAARVLAERGHDVVLFEAGARLGGQIRLAALAGWRRDLIAIVDWREAELETLGVSVRTNVFAGAEEIAAEAPDVVIMATGGLPDTTVPEGGEELVKSTWDALSEPQSVGRRVLVVDGTGRHQAPSTALALAEAGRDVHLVTVDEFMAAEMEYQSRITYRKKLAQHHARVDIDLEILKVEREGNGLKATLGHMLTGERIEILADDVIVDCGSVPFDELYREMRGAAANGGTTHLDELLALQPQPGTPVPSTGGYAMHQIGDATASRSIHAAIYDAFRLCLAI
ncbi:NADH:flavin oxidoreductase [Poseidonocella sp. HB161398]|uniref:NADH:flavin oxidoreductase n=1 Tax=Poseidonocella sp. HB161398 TaxID=2320855 RepID=UPI001F1149EA|nr:NADH:flavin oxidoreductase [Poseidonocella sp. HB161398]